jgi:hypothetical protein
MLFIWGKFCAFRFARSSLEYWRIHIWFTPLLDELCPVVSGSVFVFIWGGVYSKASTWEEKKSLSVAFNSTFRYIDDVLSITCNNNHFHSDIDSIYPNELEIKDTTQCSTSASYLDVLLKLDTNGKLSTQLYDKLDNFNFSIVNFPYLCSNIPASPAYGVYISQLIRYARACSTYHQFLVRCSLLTYKLMSQGFQMSRLQAAFHKFYGRYNNLIYPYNLSLGHMLSDMFHNNR